MSPVVQVIIVFYHLVPHKHGVATVQEMLKNDAQEGQTANCSQGSLRNASRLHNVLNRSDHPQCKDG